MEPKTFISYSWSSPGHQARIRQWAEQLVSDGIDVVLDVWDLKEGDDKYTFMERMVTDDSVTHVLVFSDREYSVKADKRQAGVGTESQIISQKIYSKARQSKFIFIVCEFDDDDEPFLPTFLKARIWIDFSSPEAVNENWEKLIRILYDKPAHIKPTLGKTPAYILSEQGAPASPAISKFAVLRQALVQAKPGIGLYRRDFLDAVLMYVDELRVREKPDIENIGERTLEDCGKLKMARDHIVNWVLLESELSRDDEFRDALVEALERLLALKAKAPELTSWSDSWLEAHRVFVYETFLYVVAALLKTSKFDLLHLIFTTHYLCIEEINYCAGDFQRFDAFHGYSRTLQVLAPEGRKLLSPEAELIKRQADREDIAFDDVIQAELLVLLMVLISPDLSWYPHTSYYSSYNTKHSFFLRAAQHRHFLKLAEITGINDANQLRSAVRAGQERLRMANWTDFRKHDILFWQSLNMDALDTLR